MFAIFKSLDKNYYVILILTFLLGSHFISVLCQEKFFLDRSILPPS